jgi:hypothetical protein
MRDPSAAGSAPKQNILDDYDSTDDLTEIIDTAMLRACIQTSDPSIFILLGGNNRCNLKESIKMLTDSEVSGPPPLCVSAIRASDG